MPAEVKQELEFVLVETVDELLAAALETPTRADRPACGLIAIVNLDPHEKA